MNLAAQIKSNSWLLGFGVFFSGGLLFFGFAFSGHHPPQPIRFNHAIHVSNGLACEDCHVGARTQEKATLPGLDTCLGCHQEAVTDKPEEEKIRHFARSNQEIRWIQITRVPVHVYFSHRRHVALGGLKCVQCHGAVETQTEPPQRPFRSLAMQDCIDCHQQRKVSNDCNDCHR